MALLLGIDTGGTYTDAVLYDEQQGVIATAKALTTKHDLAIGIGQALEEVLRANHSEISLVSLSTTLATNAIVEGQGCSICLILIGYPKDSLDLAGLGKAIGSDPVVFIEGGHTINGDEQRPLDLEAARQAILQHAGQEAFAVSGYFAVHNPTHELAVRDLVRQLTDKPVTCGHELTSNLHAPRRALTAALNARLIPFLAQLIHSVGDTLQENGIHAPLMVVKGDGSLVESQVALERPVETILSGPAASVVGARHLSKEGDVMVVDMGGTTTDIAILEGKLPALSRDGAVVGGWHTMVEAIAAHTCGLGGDSEVRLDGENGLAVGPQRVVPLCLLAQQYSSVLETLRCQHRQASQDHRAPKFAARFALRQRWVDGNVDALDTDEQWIWNALADQPLSLESLYADRMRGLWLQRALTRLVNRGLVVEAGLTPTDAAHVLRHQASWSLEAARLGAELVVLIKERQVENLEKAGVEFCQQLLQQVSVQLGRSILAAALGDQGEALVEQGGSLRRIFFDAALGDKANAHGLVDISFTLKRSLVAVGAPVSTYFPVVAERLHTRLVIPQHAEVANAVGAVVGSIVQVLRMQIRRLPEWQVFRVHLPSGVRDFDDIDGAASFAQNEAARLVEIEARRAGADNPQVQVERMDHIYHPEDGNWEDVYLGTEILARGVGRPRLGGL